ncbi:MAG: hypothetical protein IJC93_07465 [Clostridia bacterium]|nr:hypothetical protein [Clostridia bacterium]
MLPTIQIGNLAVSRLIVGGNPFSGNSHVNGDLNDQMIDYFTTAKLKETLFHCEECGINTMQLRGDAYMWRIVREYRNEGGKMLWIAQTASEYGSFEGNVNTLANNGADAIYHHGTKTDSMFKDGEIDILLDRLKIIRATGLPVGLATHMPEVIYYAEEHNWDVDFYMGCVYNLSRENRVSSAITGIANSGEAFYEEDIPLMYEAIRAAKKPCLAFKILGATRRCQSQETVQAAFDEAFREIKPTDGVIVGVYPNGRDEVALDARYTREAIEKLQA